MHFANRVEVIYESDMAWPRENSVRDDVVIRTKRSPDGPEYWKDPDEGEKPDEE